MFIGVLSASQARIKQLKLLIAINHGLDIFDPSPCKVAFDTVRGRISIRVD